MRDVGALYIDKTPVISILYIKCNSNFVPRAFPLLIGWAGSPRMHSSLLRRALRTSKPKKRKLGYLVADMLSQTRAYSFSETSELPAEDAISRKVVGKKRKSARDNPER